MDLIDFYNDMGGLLMSPFNWAFMGAVYFTVGLSRQFRKTS